MIEGVVSHHREVARARVVRRARNDRAGAEDGWAIAEERDEETWRDLDVQARRLHLDVSDEELARRRAAWQPMSAPEKRGYANLYVEHVNQADVGCDLDFLVGGSGAPVPRESH